MLDEGFIRQWVDKFRQTATNGQGRNDYQDDLSSQIDGLAQHVSVAFAGKERDYLQAIAGSLKGEADLSEAYDPKVSNKLTDPQLNTLGRVAVLREAIEMIKAIPSKP